MTADPKSSPPSFSVARRWKIGFDVVARTVLVVAVVIMANYAGSMFSHQFFLSAQTRVHLSPRTVSVLQSLTNRVDVTVYYDKNDSLYPMVMALLNEYQRLDPRIHVSVVDYLRDPGEAAQVAAKYHLVASDKNMIIFDCVGANPPQFKVAPGEMLAQYGPVGMKGKQIEFRPVAFNGEKMFTSMLLAVTNPKPFVSYFLQGDGEPSLTDSSGSGYLKFAAILNENYVKTEPLTLLGNQNVPADCNLLVIAGPTRPFTDDELAKIDHYLSQGGRLMVLLDYHTINNPTGLENLLAQWGVNVGNGYVIDRDNGGSSDGTAVFVQRFSQHPAVNALNGSSVVMVLPRPVGEVNNSDTMNDTLTVTVLAKSSENSVLSSAPGYPPQDFPLMVAVEQSSVKGVARPNGNMRMIVAGDSLFLNNQIIGQVPANADFASAAANWLLDRPMLLKGIGPSPVMEFRLKMTREDMRNVRWLLLAALPGTVLAFGGIVWLRRRQ